MIRTLGMILMLVSRAEPQSAPNPLPRRLTLPQAENLLIERNLSVLAARYQIEANRAARLIASYKPNPVLTIGAEQIPFYSPIAGSFPRFLKTNPDAGANPVYTLRIDKIWERGGKRELRTALADAQLKASEAQMLDAVRTQLFQLRRAFAAATLARENLKLAETTEQQYVQTQALTQVKVEQGDIARVELYRVGAGRLQYQQAVLQARTAYDSALRDVLTLLGAREQDVETSIAQTTSLEPILPPARQIPDSLRTAPLEIIADFDDRSIVQTLSELRTITLAERPDVLAARHLLESAESAMQFARAQRTRDVDTAYEYQRVGNDHSAGFVVQVPLFLNNNQRALYTQAEAQKRAAEAQLKQAELQATTDVEKTYQSYLSARRVLDLYSAENLGQLDRLRTVANVSYREGASSLFELLDAQRAYSAAMTAYNQARSDYQLTLWGLEQATGTSIR
jgi:cobalt-zinc-cadmium efflux system outer membrane protein